MSDKLDLLREQKKILSEEVALQSNSLKRLLDEAVKSPQIEKIKEEIKMLNDDIKAKNDQIATLEKQILEFVMTSHEAFNISDIVQTCECEVLQVEVANLTQQLSDALDLAHGTNIEELKQKAEELSESKERLEQRNRKLAEESSYAKGLASAAAVELKALSEEVAKLMNQNERLAAELATQKTPVIQRNKTGTTTTTNVRNNGRRESLAKRQEQESSSMELKRELRMSKERELSYEAALVERDQREAELQRMVEESKQREAYLENEIKEKRNFNGSQQTRRPVQYY